MIRETHQMSMLYDQICREVPPNVTNKIAWVRPRAWVADVEVAFRLHDGSYRRVYISTWDWLNDAAIARLCLEAP